jgi:uncharacterized Zn finger protein (UPF0148 family)
MSGEGRERERDPGRLKEAASLLTKGGTLINDPCDLCGSVQVMFRDKVICVNCGNEKSVVKESYSVQRNKQENQQPGIQKRNNVMESSISRPSQKPVERYTKQNINVHRRDLEQIAPPLQDMGEAQKFPPHKDGSEQVSLRNISLLLIEKISGELTNIKEEEGPELLRRKAETIRIWLGLLQKVKEIERL